MNNILSLEDANKLVILARIKSNGPVLDKLRRISHYIEQRMKDELSSYAS